MLFMQVADKMPTKYKLFQSFFAHTSVFKDKKSKKSQNSKIKGFLTFLHVNGFYGMVG
jgi:hypothetical protein